MPLADGERGPAERRQHFGQKAVGERHTAIGAGEAGGAFGDACHGVGMVVAAREERGPARRAQGRRVEVAVAHAVLGELIHVRRLADWRAVAAKGRVANIVEDDV